VRSDDTVSIDVADNIVRAIAMALSEGPLID
jgi:hypothetical protein